METLDDWFASGIRLHQQGKLTEALVAFQQALFISRNPTTLSALATIYSELKKYSQALELAQEALAFMPEHPQLEANVGVLLAYLGQYDAALIHYDNTLSKTPDLPVALINRGAILIRLNRKKEALAHNKNALERLPHIFETHFNYADSLIGYFCYKEALAVCDKGLRIAPYHSQLHLQRGICLAALKQFSAANDAIAIARKFNPIVLKTYLRHLKTDEDAINLELDSRHIYLESKNRERKVCYWQHSDEYESFLMQYLLPEVEKQSPLREAAYAFQMLALGLNNIQRLQLSRMIANKLKDQIALDGSQVTQIKSKNATNRIRLAYVSPDFRQHATSVLTRQIYGMHDRGQFEVYCYSLHNNEQVDQYRKDIESSCDVFFDASSMTAIELVQKIADDEIDILVDLAGYTTHSKFEIFALKPAPVQITYLGYQSTIGAEYIDYAIVDSVICPENTDIYWQEKLIRLPNSVWPYDSDINNVSTRLKPTDYRLPEDTFVFCCLNNNYKIEPVAFTAWMNILKAVPDSVLWLLADEVDTEDNLMREAEVRGVAKDRLIFAHRVSLDEHVARFQLADLFLDTRWHNAHTTGAEALWQGLPMITCMSEQASSRGAGSLLYGLEMPELVVESFEAYEELAIFYATHPAEYQAMREKLKAKRYTAPLFDIKLKVKHLERAYRMAWQRYQAGLPPEAINVPI
ncbi:MAG TPA: tetratricopeptide repeat protein [Methyloradius sp.]